MAGRLKQVIVMERKSYTDSFASIYDDIMGAVPYSLWYDYLHEIMDYFQVTADRVLDLACGTGTMSLFFSRKGYRVTGIDNSYEMLKRAKKKAQKEDRDINFFQADLREFNLDTKYDMAFCLFDSLNYILKINELTQVFKNVYSVLKGEGFFIFDMNTLKRLMSIKPGSTVLKGDSYSCIWEDIINREKKQWQVKLKIYLKEKGDYFEELHQETGYPLSLIKKSLSSAGFEYIDVFSAYTFSKGTEKDNRIYFVAFKNKDHVKKKPVLIKSVKEIKWRFKKMITGR